MTREAQDAFFELFDAVLRVPGAQLQVWEEDQPWAHDGLRDWAHERNLKVKTRHTNLAETPAVDTFEVEAGTDIITRITVFR